MHRHLNYLWVSIFPNRCPSTNCRIWNFMKGRGYSFSWTSKMDYKEGWMIYWTSSSKPFGRIWEVVLDAKKLTSPKNDPNGASTAVKLPHATIVPSAKMAPLFSNNPAEKKYDPICFSKNIPQNAYCITPNATVHCSRILHWILGVLILSDADTPRLWESSNLKLKSPKETYSYGPSMWKS